MNYPKEKIKNIVTPLLLEPESIWLCSFCTFANSVSSKICEVNNC